MTQQFRIGPIHVVSERCHVRQTGKRHRSVWVFVAGRKRALLSFTL